MNRYFKKSILHTYEGAKVEYMTNFDDQETIIVGHILDEITKSDMALYNQKKPKLITLNHTFLATVVGVTNTDDIEELIHGLMSRRHIISWGNIGSGKVQILPTFNYITYEDKKLTFEIHPIWIPILLDLKNKHPNGRWHYVIRFNSSCSAALYMILQNHTGEVTFDLNYIKDTLSFSYLYSRYNNFKEKILMVAKNEINKKSDLQVNFEEVLDKKRVIQLKFTITHKLDYEPVIDQNLILRYL